MTFIKTAYDILYLYKKKIQGTFSVFLSTLFKQHLGKRSCLNTDTDYMTNLYLKNNIPQQIEFVKFGRNLSPNYVNKSFEIIWSTYAVVSMDTWLVQKLSACNTKVHSLVNKSHKSAFFTALGCSSGCNLYRTQ